MWGGGGALLKISASFRSAAVCLSPSVVSGIFWVGLRREWVISAAAYVAESLEDSPNKVSVSGGKSVVSEILYLTVLGM